MAASAHQRAVGQFGLGSPATQLMRAVSRHFAMHKHLIASLISGLGLVTAVACTPTGPATTPLATSPPTQTLVRLTATMMPVGAITTPDPELTITPFENATSTMAPSALNPTDTVLNATTFPTYVPEIPSSPSECLLTAQADPDGLHGLWMRWMDPDRLQYELLFFRSESTVSIWMGGYAFGIGNIDPVIRDGSYQYLHPRTIELRFGDWEYGTLEYGVCGDLLAVYDPRWPGKGVYAYVRTPETCWDNPAADYDQCYPKLKR